MPAALTSTAMAETPIIQIVRMAGLDKAQGLGQSVVDRRTHHSFGALDAGEAARISTDLLRLRGL